MISFRSNINNSYPTQQPQKQNNNIFSVSPNAQEVLNKTNEYANGVQIANAIIEPENRKENLKKALTNGLMMPIMSTTPVSAIYTAKELKDGNITKQDAIKIIAYNSMAQALD